MAVTTYYISDFANKQDLTGFNFIGVEFEYPDQLDSYLTAARAINWEFSEMLKKAGIYTVKTGNWDEKILVANDPEKSWLSGGIVEIYRNYHIDHNFKYYPHKVVAIEDFIKAVKDQF